jgi:hypothetical protein
MMAHSISIVLICNMALDHVGTRSTIEAITEESTEAKKCNLWYDYSRLQVLEDFNWNFARKRLTMAAHGDDPPSGIWTYRYQYPADCVKIREVEHANGIDSPPFEVEMSEDGTKSVLTNAEDAILVYTFDQTTPEFFSSKFVDALSWKLAAHIAFSLTGKRAIVQDALRTYEVVLRSAMAANASEGVDDKPREAEHIRART